MEAEEGGKEGRPIDVYRERRRAEVVAAGYALRHPSLAHFTPDHLTARLREHLAARESGGETEAETTDREKEEGQRRPWPHAVGLMRRWRDLHCLRLFSSSFERMLIEEVEHYMQSPAPKTSEIVLEEIGLEGFVHGLFENVLRPLIKEVYPDIAAESLQHHYSFIIRNLWWESDDFQLWRYVDEETGEPTSRHVDDSVITFNMCLGIDFEGAELRFYGDKKSERYSRERYYEYDQVPGIGVMHMGNNEHEVLPMTSRGRRYNLIIWLS